MKMTKEGYDLLIEREGLYLKSYKCQAKKWTIGIGTTYYPDGSLVKEGDTCTKEQAYEWLDYELKEKSASIERWNNKYNYSLTGNQFSALLSFAYNCGTGYLSNPDTEFCQAILSRNEARIRKAFGAFNKYTIKRFGISFKKESNGLTIRRKREADLFLKKD